MRNVSASLFGVARFSANNAEEENCTTHAINKSNTFFKTEENNKISKYFKNTSIKENQMKNLKTKDII